MAYDSADMIIYRQRDGLALVLDARVGGIHKQAIIPVGKIANTGIYSLLEKLAKVGVKKVQCAFYPNGESNIPGRWQDGERKKLLETEEINEINELLRLQAGELSRKDKPISITTVSQTTLLVGF